MTKIGTGGPVKNGGRYWGNFLSFQAVGGRREPLVPEGAKLATTNAREARRLFEVRRTFYHDRLARLTAGLTVDSPTLAAYAATFLSRLVREVRVDGSAVHSVHSLDRRRRGIMTCLDTPAFRAVRSVEALTRQQCDAMLRQLAVVPKASGEALLPATVRSYAAEMSALLGEAVLDGLRTDNPLLNQRAMPKPKLDTALDDDKFLNREEGRRLLDFLLPSPRLPLAVEIGAVFLYTGGRRHEVLGILVRDVDFLRGEVSLYDNGYRNLKNRGARRRIPLWPAMRMIFERLCAGRDPNELLFPAVRLCGAPQSIANMIGDINGTLRAAAQRARITKKVTHHTLRHTYISARLTMQHRSLTGVLVPVDEALVVLEVGHTTTEMIRTTYGHLTRERVASTMLSYGEAAMDYDTRRALARADHGARISAGLAAKKMRAAAPSAPVLTSGPPLTTEEASHRRKEIARQIRKRVRAARWLDADFVARAGATPSEASGVMRGDHARFGVERLAELLERVVSATARPPRLAQHGR